MPDAYTQADAPMRFKAGNLGDDDLLLVRFDGTEALSALFAFTVELLAPLDAPVDFAQVLGQSASIAIQIPSGEARFLHGIVSRFAQGKRDDTFLTYRLELVPPVWLLTQRTQSRIFQHQSVPDILKKVLDGFDVTYQLQGTFEPRDYCVQYRESDFDFASRLMEEEGIYYYFRHLADGCEMVVANTPQAHDDIPAPTTLIYDEVEGGERDEGRITGWERAQEVRSGKVTLWDHSFELPHKHLEADQKIQESVAAGSITHKLNLDGTDQLERYDYPGAYAQRFDGIGPGGAEHEQALKAAKITLPRSMIADGNYTFESGVMAADRLLDLMPRPTAIFACNDEMAAGVLHAARQRGIDVPRDLSIIGFDDTPIAAHIWPPLTTVRWPIISMARSAALEADGGWR